MKKQMFMLAALLTTLFGTHAMAATVGDTLVIEKPSKVKIETRDTVQRIVINGSKDDEQFHYVQRIAIPDSNAVRREISNVKDFNKITISKKKDDEKDKIEASFHANWGLATMLSAPDGYDFKLWPSFDYGLGITVDWHPFGDKNYWSIGLMCNWRQYRMSNDTYWVKDASNAMTLTPYASTQSDCVTSLEEFSLSVPLLYTHYFDDHRGWGVSLGGIVNFNTGAHSTRKFSINNEDYEIRTKGIGQRPITVDVLGIVHIPSFFDVYCRYCPMKFFKDDRGPKMHQFSFGLMF